MTSNDYDYGACLDYADHQDPQQLDGHRWRCEVCGTEWTETDDVEIEAEGTRSGVALRIGSASYSLDYDTAHLLIDQVQAALRDSALSDGGR